MNKYQRALDNLVEKALCWIEDRALTTHMAKRQAEAITKREALLQDLVDKAAPKKAILKEGYSPIEDCYGEWFYCPSCNVFLSDKDNLGNFCHNCGQALKWSDEEDYVYDQKNLDELLKKKEEQNDEIAKHD
jgi:hypothetical protein